MQTLKKSLNNKEGIKLKIPNDASYISLVRLIISARLRECFAEEESIDDLKLVLSEFLAKAIELKIAKEYFSIEINFNSENIFEVSIGNLEEYDPQILFNSPYLDFTAISELIDHFDLLLAQNQTLTTVIAKKIKITKNL